ncbi:MAG: helix-hairpin-helix domain-containing protein [Halanaeroarchaeum sp.]
MTSRNVPDTLQDVKFIGPATADVLEDADVTPGDVVERRVSHAQLIRAGVNAGVAARIRREHSLAWSIEGGEDLDQRAEQVRGLQSGEREWVAASSGSWEDEPPTGDAASTDGRGDESDEESLWQLRSWPSEDDATEANSKELAWRKASKPTPVTDLETLGDGDASLLGEAGITSVRRLATANPERVADSLDVDVETVREWREAARSRDRPDGDAA